MENIKLSLGICRNFLPWEQGLDARHIILIATSHHSNSTTWYHIIGGGLHSPSHPYQLLTARRNLNKSLLRAQISVTTLLEKHLDALEAAVHDASANFSHFWVLNVLRKLKAKHLLDSATYGRCCEAVLAEVPGCITRDYLARRAAQVAPPPALPSLEAPPRTAANLPVAGARGTGAGEGAETLGGDFVTIHAVQLVREWQLAEWEVVGEDEAASSEDGEQDWVLLDR
ncbi:hypothetical protein B0H67DRAFT_682813 [Lasiosphaeris hirsuta]|uniref:Uncharacterized protein n=1 Tax=Lasiosphaeris hirsuta TaxID=260670 RepID=A0AA40AS61_9PEZI|nr:hypothetical protein B0H67DRAFT_682813 [Lasiosphaeris hirsuta]